MDYLSINERTDDQNISNIFPEPHTDIEYMSLKDFCDELSISTATGRNWIKLGKISPQYREKKNVFFSREYVKKYKEEIQSGKRAALKSRRNKKYISGNELYNSYVSKNCASLSSIQNLLFLLNKSNEDIDDNKLQILIADCAIQLLAQKCLTDLTENNCNLIDFLDGIISFGSYDSLIDDLIIDKNFARKWHKSNRMFFDNKYIYEKDEDILGLLYLSCKNIGNRKVTGSYYTPTIIVRKMITNVYKKNNDIQTILDPCCGTGNFLLQLPDDIDFNQVYASDIDAISIKIARINMALKFENININNIYNNIKHQNYLSEYYQKKFDLIIGNPPWGYSFQETENIYIKKRYRAAKGKNIESYDIFIEKALEDLNIGGILSFVLPEAILNVKAHIPVRKIIMENSDIQYVEFLGNVFDNVQCPSIILQIKNTGKTMKSAGMEVCTEKKVFEVKQERKINPEYFNFAVTDIEYNILNIIFNIPNSVYLKNNAVFALGIVTGNNKKYILNSQSKDSERILKGTDIYKYRVKDCHNYIVFQPDVFQQVAPEAYYRAREKLLYRFICNQLVFAYDDNQTLSLNSCNIVIPEIADMEIKYILAILNSRIAQFVFQKNFNSVKILRAHIEQIPIPLISIEQQRVFIEIVDRLCSENSEKELNRLYEHLDEKIRLLYSLNDEEYQIIKRAVDGQNKFLV